MRKVSVVAIEHPFLQGLFLHGKRKDSGKWCLPGGHGLEGELPVETARRELKEETGLDIHEMEECRNGCFEGPVEDEGVHVHLFRAKPQEGVAVDHTVDPDGEFSEFRYINPLVNDKMHVPTSRNVLIHFLQDGQKIQKAEPKLPPKRVIFDDPWDQEKYDRGGEDEWEEFWEQEKQRRQKYYEEKFGPLKKAQSGSKDKDAEIQHQVMNSLPDLGDVKKKISMLGAVAPKEFKHPGEAAGVLGIPADKLQLHQLYRSYKHTPHAPLSLLAKYAVHRIENRDAYTQADEATKNKLDSDFMTLHQKGGAAEKNGHVLMPHLHYALHGHPHILSDLLEHQRQLHDKIKTQAAWAIHDIEGDPHLALTRGLNVSKLDRGPDHALASYGDVPDPGFGFTMHHQYVPLKNVWYSYDVGPKAATSLKHGNENEYLVSPHENVYQNVNLDPSKTVKIFPDALHDKMYDEKAQMKHRLKNDRNIPWSDLLDPEETMFKKAGINHEDTAGIIINAIGSKGVHTEKDMNSLMDTVSKWPKSDGQDAMFILAGPVHKYLNGTNYPVNLKWADWFYRMGSNTSTGQVIMGAIITKHMNSGYDYQSLSPEHKKILKAALEGDSFPRSGYGALAIGKLKDDPEGRKVLQSIFGLSGNTSLTKFEDLEKKLVFEGNPTVPHREVWRVQNEMGKGPYTGVKEEEWREKPHNDFSHPVPHQDRFEPSDLDAMTDFHQIPGSVKHDNPVFGFESEFQLKKWFSPVELARLDKLGFKPTKVKARKVWSSGTQAFFLPHHDEIQKSWTGKIPGAVTVPKGPSEFPPHKIREGMAVEAEHTTDPEYQIEIATIHENEDPNYYPKLRVAEGEIGPRDKLRKLIRKKA